MINILGIGRSVLWANSLLITSKGGAAAFYFDETTKSPDAVLLNTQTYTKAQIEKFLNRFPRVPVFIIHNNMNYMKGRVVGVFNFATPTEKIEQGILYFLKYQKAEPKFETNPEANTTERTIPVKEQIIREALMQGMSNKQIARTYDLPLSTIKYHLSKTYQKLDVSNRTEAALMLQKSSL